MKRLLFVFALSVFFYAPGAWAQLTGTDTTPGSSCAGFPSGSTRMTADADLDGAQVVLVCNGTNWIATAGGSGTPAGADTQIQFNSSGAYGADSLLVWDRTNKRLTVGGTSGFWGNLQITGTGPSLEFYDSDAPAASGGGLNGSGLTIRDSIGQVAGRLGFLNTDWLILQNNIAGGDIRINANDDILFYASATERMRLTDAGYLGINDNAPSVALDVVGDINYTGVIVDVSDIRMKYDIRPLDRPLEKISALNGFSFKMVGDDKRLVEYGVSAQDVQKVFPELVHQVDTDGTLGVAYDGLIAPMIEALKEQQNEIDGLRAELEALKQQVNKPD